MGLVMPLKDVVEIPQFEAPVAASPQVAQPSLLAGVTDRILNRLYSLGRIGKEVIDQTGVAGVMPGAERDELKAGRDTLLGANGKERYQLWPERTVRDALAAPHDVAQTQYGELTSQDLIKPALDVAALAGTGGLGAGGGTLNATPSLRPALKFNEKIYKAPPGGQHLDALSPEMYNEFQKLAMKGEDINHYNFGFMNHKGQFLSRENALQYAIDHGLLNPNSEAARAGTLTSTMDLQP